MWRRRGLAQASCADHISPSPSDSAPTVSSAEPGGLGWWDGPSDALVPCPLPLEVTPVRGQVSTQGRSRPGRCAGPAQGLPASWLASPWFPHSHPTGVGLTVSGDWVTVGTCHKSPWNHLLLTGCHLCSGQDSKEGGCRLLPPTAQGRPGQVPTGTCRRHIPHWMLVGP